MNTLRIATRKSQLALWQANFVADLLQRAHPELGVELVEIVSQGDRTLDVPLAAVGGKGLFLKELEQSLLDGESDIAVHSMKDVTVTLPDGLMIATICEREDPRDAFVSNHYSTLEAMPEGGVVGSCSLRRRCQVQAAYPRLEVRDLRGNVNTRLGRLDAGDYDALILATAGLVRLGFADRITQCLDTDLLLPAVGQGAVGIECRQHDNDTIALLQALGDPQSTLQLQAERAANARLGGGCHVPVAAYAEITGEQMRVRARVGQPDGSVILSATTTGRSADAVELGEAAADQLIAQGALEILADVYAN